MKEKDKLLKAIFGAPTLKMRLNRLLFKRRKALLYLTWCDACETYMLICPKCGNNCCNGGYGQVFDVKVESKDCDMCPHIYALQYWNDRSEWKVDL